MPRAVRPSLLCLLLVLALAVTPVMAAVHREVHPSRSQAATAESAPAAGSAWAALASVFARLLGQTDPGATTIPAGHTQAATAKPSTSPTSDLGGTMDPDG